MNNKQLQLLKKYMYFDVLGFFSAILYLFFLALAIVSNNTIITILGFSFVIIIPIFNIMRIAYAMKLFKS